MKNDKSLKLNFEPLKEIMKKMGINKELDPKVEILKKRKITWKKISTLSGLDININEVTSSKDGYIEYEGFSKLIAYIKDQKFYKDNIDFNNSKELKKFHIAYNCPILMEAKNKKATDKFKIVLNKSPEFLINIFLKGLLREKNVKKELKVCQYCLDTLHYKGYNHKNMSFKEKEKFVDNFSFEEFLGEEFENNEKEFKDIDRSIYEK